MMLHRLRRPNLLESQTAMVLRAMSTIARFTSDSKRFGVKSPALVSKPSTPKNKMSALSWRKVRSASGPTREKEFLRSMPPVRITSMFVPASSAAMLIAFVITVSCAISFNARSTAVVVLPESSSTDQHLLFTVQLLFFTQRRIGQSSRWYRQRTAMSALDYPLTVEEFQIFA